MLKFVDIPLKKPNKISVSQRKQDFSEIYVNFAKEKAEEQASRCSQCGVPFCQVHCPLHNNIPDWLKLTAENRLEEAHELSSSTNNMPEICGRICPQDRLCEGNCVIETSGHGTVTIGSVEKYINDFAWDNGWIKNIEVEKESSLSIGIIGSGPAGLAAAEQLRIKGYQITIYDRYDRPGGLLIYGIPNFKLDKQIVNRRTKRLLQSGINFKLNCEIGSTISFDEIKEKHDAILIATGVYKPRTINLNNKNFSNVVPALEYLIASNKKGLKDRVPKFDDGHLNSFKKNVLVIGGGDTAMDCVRTAVRQGAESVTCLYRRDKKNMPGSLQEVENAIEEGINFEWLTLPTEYIGNGKIDKTKIVRMQLGSPDESGRRKSEPIIGSENIIETDLIIEALGFEPENIPNLFNKDDLVVTNWGTIKIDFKTMMTSIDGVFAAGDIVRGASLVVWGIKDGRDAAENIHQYLLNKSKDLMFEKRVD
ncbi:MAG: Glutamate synthase [NADPH] small chain [Alphaproteobacteria bacterium MarineAlpha5_Bin8]|nr:MAG: Glutamate synthase [NADPH] small chain [Alphaproteobacteria bacterium MarineAlpha5_Bin7]PPR46241.1 MAG: Glutamate synthase [NADPH] small chain [Alphaproteobacteria bacterium MarineAlpha5_Bin8]PPR54996.1 MAG: Glutamate synthase [NADPH] small chain [Alphaproteobacteria bacterium MarineAlpha5_Bin6]|tara:strand:+ start:6464 stop:7900 length:1437 start_codon:yes stop_codon:yes gene_type:complete